MSSLDSTSPGPGAGPTGTDPRPTQPSLTRPADGPPPGQGWVGAPDAGGPPPGGHGPQGDARPPRRRGPGWLGLVVVALVDAAGRVVGINSSIASPSQGGGQAGSVGLGFAIPADEAKRISSELVGGGRATHAQLGVDLAGQDSTATADGTTRQAAEIARVVAGSPADTAGLRTGDQVVAVDGVATPGSDSLVAVVGEHAPGDQVVLSVVRGGRTQEITATLAQRQR